MHPQFSFWFDIGFKHIITWQALDHILYVIALCLSMEIKEWRKILWSVTAFTIGHSITLILVSLKIVNINTSWVEFFIPITIAITAFINMFLQKMNSRWLLYGLAVIFGLVHGLAFGANELASFFTATKDLLPLTLAFNLGVEVAQIIVVAAYLIYAYFMTKWVKTPHQWLKICLSSLILIYALYLALKNLP